MKSYPLPFHPVCWLNWSKLHRVCKIIQNCSRPPIFLSTPCSSYTAVKEHIVLRYDDVLKDATFLGMELWREKYLSKTVLHLDLNAIEWVRTEGRDF